MQNKGGVESKVLGFGIWAFLSAMFMVGCGGSDANLPLPDPNPPSVLSTTPVNGATGISVDTTVTATFSKGVKNVTSATFRLSAGTYQVPGTVMNNELVVDNSVWMFVPASPLSYGVTYTASVMTGVTGHDGSPLPADTSWTFTTEFDTIPPPPNTIPVADAGPDQSVTFRTIVTLDGSGSTDADGDFLYSNWSFVSRPAESNAVLSNAYSVHPTFPADREGDFVVLLRVTDARGGEAFDTVTVTVWTPPTAPIANAGLNRSAITGSAVTLDGSNSTDENGDSLTYSWTIVSKPAGSAAVLSSASDICPTFTADRDGVYVAQLIVVDGSLDSIPDTVTITAAPSTIGVSLPATGEDVISFAEGDDGFYHKGVVWPSPRFMDHGDGTVTDYLTGLMWLKEAGCMAVAYPEFDRDGTAGDGQVTWQHALDFVKAINAGTYVACSAGYADWRLPNIKELRSLVDYSFPSGALPDGHPFVSQPENKYDSWSSSTDLRDTSRAWEFVLKVVIGTEKYNFRSVWPVRSGETTIAPAPVALTGQKKCYDEWGFLIPCAGTGQDGELQAGVAWPSPRFIVGTGVEEDCVTDTLTRLMWERSPSSEITGWYGALGYANNLSLCGYTDWRLPNINELDSLADRGEVDFRWLEKEGFTNIVIPTGAINWNWSSTVVHAPFYFALWAWGSNGGVVTPIPSDEPHQHWAVRGGR